MVDGERRVTYSELAERAVRATRAVMAAGVEPGDRVAIWAPNTLEFIVAALGILGAGAWLVPVNTRFKGDEAAYVLRKSGARVLFTVDGFLGIDYVELLDTRRRRARRVVPHGDAVGRRAARHRDVRRVPRRR